MTDNFSDKFAQALVDYNDEFPVDFDTYVELFGSSKKSLLENILELDFLVDEDYSFESFFDVDFWHSHSNMAIEDRVELALVAQMIEDCNTTTDTKKVIIQTKIMMTVNAATRLYTQTRGLLDADID